MLYYPEKAAMAEHSKSERIVHRGTCKECSTAERATHDAESFVWRRTGYAGQRASQLFFRGHRLKNVW